MNKIIALTSAFVGQVTRRQARLSAWASSFGILAFREIGRTSRAKSVVLISLLLVVAGICSAQLTEADPEQQKRSQPDYYQQEKLQRIAQEEQEKFRFRVSIEDAVGDDVPLAFPTSPPVENATVPKSMSDSDDTALQGSVLLVVSILTLILALRVIAPKFFKAIVRKLSPWSGNLRPVTSLAAEVRAEDEAFEKFLTTFHAGPTDSPSGGAPEYNGQQDAGDISKEFYAKTDQFVATLRTLLEDLNRTTEDMVRHRILSDLRREMTMFKSMAISPDFLPAWQLASALDGLLKQLSDKAGNITRSTLRTVVGAVDLLEELCKPEVRNDILINPPLKFLVVDDDAICRTAVSLALKKALNQPDLADSGETALGLAESQAYDVIFLDVQMPGMDGFELCSKIHETSANTETPVIFITGMSEFDARAQSIVSGGSDLIGKPFLTFEITVKALTFALGRRLQSKDNVITHRDVVTSALTLPPKPVSNDESAATPNAPRTAGQTCVIGVPPELTVDTDLLALAMLSSNMEVASRPDDLSADNLKRAFLTRASSSLASLRGLIPKANESMDETTRQEMLADLYLGLHALTPMIDPATGHPAMRLISALEGMVRKLLEDLKHWTLSSLLTISNALDLMDDLCATGLNADFAPNSPIRMLVVDDDPLSRRAIACALQMTFGKPESAENGEAALALAQERAFDMIFMDVQMPGMDGFTACSKIRQTAINHNTPVVFVTGKVDGQTRAQVAVSGGNGLIAKPFLMSEVTVKALTFIFQGRLRELYSNDPSANPTQAIDEVTSGDALPLDPDSTDDSIAATNTPQTTSQDRVAGKLEELTANADQLTLAMRKSNIGVADGSDNLPTDTLERTFLTRASTDIAALRSHILATPETMDETVRQDTLADLYVGLHELTPKIDPSKGHPAQRLVAALEGLIKKLLEDPKHWTLSALLTIVNALDLMDELCAAQVNADFAINPPIRILVAEDDPIARRAISSALKVTFGEPEIVENGEAALDIATERAFDMIFMDVQMPDMDGFAACSRIRNTKANGNTPVVFITVQVDSHTRIQVATSGGNGLISKPFLKAEVTVKALTYSFRSRLDELYLSEELQTKIAPAI